MPLIPSESSNFPDLIGQRHGYRGPNAKSLRANPPPKENTPELTAFPSQADAPIRSLRANGARKEISPELGPSTPPQPAEPNLLPAVPLQNDIAILFTPPPLVENADDVAMSNSNFENGINYEVCPPEVILPVEILQPEPEAVPRTRAPIKPVPIKKAKPLPLPRSVVQLRSSDKESQTAQAHRPVRPKTPPRRSTVLSPMAEAAIHSPPSGDVVQPIAPEVTVFSGVQQAAVPPAKSEPGMRRTPTFVAEMTHPGLQRRRRIKLIRFVVCELVVLILLLCSARLGMSHRMPDDPLGLLTKILTITAAVVAATIPILFYGLPETKVVPRHDR